MSEILIIEDDITLTKMYVTLLSNHGFIVDSAVDGQEGLKKALENHPDLILLDIRIPKMDGVSVMHELRKDEWGKSAKIIISTNYDANDQMIKAITEDHPTYYLIKSNTQPGVLFEKIKEILDNKTNN